MKRWNAIAKYYGEEKTEYVHFSFSVPIILYNKIQEAIKNKILLKNTDFYIEICNLANEELDRQMRLYAEEFCDLPLEDDYDDEDEFNEAMEEYESEVENYIDDFRLDELKIEDPIELEIFKSNVIGKKLKKYNKNDKLISFSLETYAPDFQTFDIELIIDNGIVKGVGSINGSGLTGGDFRHTAFDNCIIDYEFILNKLIDKYLE